MVLKYQIDLCSQHYQKWKDMALSTENMSDSRKFLERAFFWLELQTAFITLFALEKTESKNPAAERKIMVAKANLSKKLAEYAQEIINELSE